MPKEIEFCDTFRRKIQSGVDQLANAVKTTLGPKGRNVVIQIPSGPPLVTNDGATIAREIEVMDHIENLGMRMVRDAAIQTKEVAGDGATTAIVLAQFILREGIKNITAGADPMELKKGIQGATQLAVAAIRKLAKPVQTREAIAQVAAVAAKSDDIGEMIAEAMQKVGAGGLITVEGTESRVTTLDVKEGMQLEVGYLSPEMVTDREKMVAELDHPYILVTDQNVTDPYELVPLLDQVARQGQPLLIIAEGMSDKTLGMLVMNKRKSGFNAAAIHPPAYGDGRRARMEDLALYTGGTFISQTTGYTLSEASLDQLGRVTFARIGKRDAILMGGAGDPKLVAARVQYLQRLKEKAAYDFDRKQLEERIAKLGSGMAIIKVGAVTAIEQKEKKQRLENALNCAKAAAVEGIVPGGGSAYIHIIPAIKAFAETLSGDMKTGAQIIQKALEEPARQIAENAGCEGSAVIARIEGLPPGFGFDVLTEQYTHMLGAGIVDSARVVRLTLQSAASVSAALLTVEAGITDS